MDNPFFDQPILNSPYEYPGRHWELDEQGQPTQKIIEKRRRAEFITPIPKPRKRKGRAEQRDLFADKSISTADQQYDPTSIINDLCHQVDQWRKLPNSNDWKVTPETARLLQHWRHHPKVRVAGPFTVESLSPHRVLGVDENDELIDNIAESQDEFGEEQGFVQMILENLKTAGVQQAHKEDENQFRLTGALTG